MEKEKDKSTDCQIKTHIATIHLIKKQQKTAQTKREEHTLHLNLRMKTAVGIGSNIYSL